MMADSLEQALRTLGYAFMEYETRRLQEPPKNNRKYHAVRLEIFPCGGVSGAIFHEELSGNLIIEYNRTDAKTPEEKFIDTFFTEEEKIPFDTIAQLLNLLKQ